MLHCMRALVAKPVQIFTRSHLLSKKIPSSNTRTKDLNAKGPLHFCTVHTDNKLNKYISVRFSFLESQKKNSTNITDSNFCRPSNKYINLLLIILITNTVGMYKLDRMNLYIDIEMYIYMFMYKVFVVYKYIYNEICHLTYKYIQIRSSKAMVSLDLIQVQNSI